MKKVLFATTALVASAGIAAADGHTSISFSGAAGAGLYDDGAGQSVYNYIDLDVDMVGETDNGVEFGASFNIRSGDKVDFGDDEYDGALSNFSFGSVYISGEFGTLTFDRDGIDNLFNDDFSHDMSYEYSINDITATVTWDVDDSATAGDHYSVQILYDNDTFLGRFEIDDTSEFELFASYAITPELTAGIEYDSNGEVITLHGDYDTDMFSVGFNYNTNDQWDLGASFTTAGFTIGGEIDEADAWTVRGEYAVGAGLDAQMYYNSDQTYAVGVVMSF